MSRTVTGDRLEVLGALVAEFVGRRQEGRVLRVAVDGRSAAGKSATAAELAALLGGRGLPVVAVSIDHFHRPGHKYRSMNREWTPELYYAEGFDYDLFRRLTLEPLAPGGSRRIQPKHWDSGLDQPFPGESVDVPGEAVVLVEGAFLGRPEFSHDFDYRVWVQISMETMVTRGRIRDAAMVGSEEEAERRYVEFWRPMHTYYEERCDPAEQADAILDNEVFARPTVELGRRGVPGPR